MERCQRCFNLADYCTCAQGQMARHAAAPIPRLRTKGLPILLATVLEGISDDTHHCMYCDRALEAALN